ncbi:MAG: hypothetical protein JW873_05105 [Candidatus Saganbacteria bacterium]|nr:hypothetical protein [Candidatus Saganbacteria bacterium]
MNEDKRTGRKTKEENLRYIDIVLNNDWIARRALLPMLFAMMLIFLSFGVPYPLLPLSLLMAIYFIGSGAVIYVISRGWGRPLVNYFLLLCWLDLIAAVAMYYTGGAESFIFPIFTVIAILAALTLPLWQIAAVVICAGVFYSAELLIEFNGWLPHVAIFKEFMPPAGYAESAYFLVIPLVNFTVLVAIAGLVYRLAQQLNGHWRILTGLNRELADKEGLLRQEDEAKSLLGRQLDGKSGELEALRLNLEKIVEERAEELKAKIGEMDRAESELKARMAELQDFRGLIDGRERRMSELRTESDALRRELGRPPKYT